MACSQPTSQSMLDELKLSGDEVKSFEKAFKDPEFVKMFGEYAQEINDPANKAETETYLRQLERQGEIENVYGKGTQLIIATPEFVFKTTDKGDGLKVFVNMCSSDKVGKPELLEECNNNGSRGHRLSLPLAGSNSRREARDKNGNRSWVYDITMHPDAFVMLHSNSNMLRPMVESAIDHIEKSSTVKLDRKFSRPKLKFKASPGYEKQPAVTAIRGEGTSATAGSIKPQSKAPPSVAPLLPQTPSAESPAPHQGLVPPKLLKRSPFAPRFANAQPAQPKTSRDPGFQHASGEVTPPHTLVHQGHRDLTEAWGDPTGRPCSGVPAALVLRVTLKGIGAASQVQLDVSATRVTVLVPGSYLLELPLPFCVTNDGRATFDRDTFVLTLTLPVSGPQHTSAAPGIATAALEENDALSEGDTGAGGVHDTALAPDAAAGRLIQEVNNDESSPDDCSERTLRQVMDEMSVADGDASGVAPAGVDDEGAGAVQASPAAPQRHACYGDGVGGSVQRGSGSGAGRGEGQSCSAARSSVHCQEQNSAPASAVGDGGGFLPAPLVARAPEKHAEHAAAAEASAGHGGVALGSTAGGATSDGLPIAGSCLGTAGEDAVDTAQAVGAAPCTVGGAAAAMQALQEARLDTTAADAVDLKALAAAWSVANASMDAKMAIADGGKLDADCGDGSAGTSSSDGGTVEDKPQSDADCAQPHTCPAGAGAAVAPTVVEQHGAAASEAGGCTAVAAGGRGGGVPVSRAGDAGAASGVGTCVAQAAAGGVVPCVAERMMAKGDGADVAGALSSGRQDRVEEVGPTPSCGKGRSDLGAGAVGGMETEPVLGVKLEMALDLPMLDELD